MENKKNKIYRKSFSRFFAVQILFSYFFYRDENEDINTLLNFFIEYYISEEFLDNKDTYMENINMDFLKELLKGTIKNIDDINIVLSKSLSGKYTFDNIDPLIRVILQLSIYEFNYTDTERKVIINEYVDIAGEYFDDKVIAFVNAIIDNLSKLKE